jgi:hypothetical protein
MKICTYTVTTDTGFAPNPFFDYCTLAACTPNHVNARLEPGDIIVGFFTDRHDPFLLYWMEISEVLNYDNYFNDPRFQRKKPKLDGSWKFKCGDNIYYRDNKGNWKQIDTLFHYETSNFIQDTRHSIVFIGNIFSYFGQKAYCQGNKLPEQLRRVLKKGQGIKYTRDSDPLFKDFVIWLKSMDLGRQGNPRDMNKINCCQKRTINICKI